MNILTDKKKAGLIAGFLFVFTLYPQPSTTVFAAFEDVETGARASAMSGAYVAQKGGVSSVFYNPAGVASLNRYEVLVSQQKLFMGLTDGSSLGRGAFALGLPLSFKNSYWGAFALSMDKLSLDSLYGETRMRISYARPFGQNVWAGLSIARFSLSYGSDEYTAINPVLTSGAAASGMGLDVGVLIKKKSVNLGFAILNANEPDMGLKYANKVSRKINAGLSVERETFTWELDLVSAGGDMKIKSGGEFPIFKQATNNKLFLRAGLAVGSRDYRFLATGFGYKTGSYSVDYSFAYPMSGISGTMGSHQLGLFVAWGKPRGPMAESEEEKKEKEKTVEAETATGAGQPQGIVEPSAADRSKAGKLMRAVRNLMRKGSYSAATETLIEVDKLLVSDPYVKDILSKMIIVKSITKAAEGDDERDDLIRKAVTKYTEKDTDAILYITYAYQKRPKDVVLARLYGIIAKEFPETAANMRMLPGITIIDQLLQDALDFIRSNRFVQAIATLQQALRLEPNNIPALTRMGSAYWAMGKKDIARNYWEKVLRLDPGNKEVIQFMRQD